MKHEEKEKDQNRSLLSHVHFSSVTFATKNKFNSLSMEHYWGKE